MTVAERVKGHSFTHTIHITPSEELIARSWQWPEAWHRAFADAACQLGTMVASHVLGGLRLDKRPATRVLQSGCISFSLLRRGTSITIAVSEFEGPYAPVPDGSARGQPSCAEGLVLGVRGTGKSFTVVTFCGPQSLPPASQECRKPAFGAWC